tara:strand:+ start:173 stop:376 length:204 start_codon:yes stop_codon:yes gene_type:complete
MSKPFPALYAQGLAAAFIIGAFVVPEIGPGWEEFLGSYGPNVGGGLWTAFVFLAGLIGADSAKKIIS